MSVDWSQLRSEVRSARTVRTSGRIVRACGTVLQVRGLATRIGEICRLCDDGGLELFAEVVGLVDEDALLMPLGSLQGMSMRTRVEPSGLEQTVNVGDDMLGQCLRCVRGIDADRKRTEGYYISSPSLATALNPIIGYAAAAEIAKESAKSGKPIPDLLREKKLLPEEKIREIFTPEFLAGQADRKK